MLHLIALALPLVFLWSFFFFLRVGRTATTAAAEANAHTFLQYADGDNGPTTSSESRSQASAYDTTDAASYAAPDPNLNVPRGCGVPDNSSASIPRRNATRTMRSVIARSLRRHRAALSKPRSQSITLRFIQGENPVQQHACDLHTPIGKLKASIASKPGSTLSDGIRIMWIFRGQMLRDERTLSDYSGLTSEEIVHVHMISNEAARLADRAGVESPQQQLEGEYLIPPNEPPYVAQQSDDVDGGALFRAIFAIYTSAIGMLWGLVFVLGNRLFSLNGFLCLLFLTGIWTVGFVSFVVAKDPPRFPTTTRRHTNFAMHRQQQQRHR